MPIDENEQRLSRMNLLTPPLEKEIRDALDRLSISLSTDDDSFWMKLSRDCSELRNRLVQEITEEQRGKKLRDGCSFWEISPKYRFNLLGNEIPWMADELAYAIACMSIYLPFVRQDVQTRSNTPSMADSLYWYHADAGIRIASSCWERIGLLLDLAFDLGLRHRCSFPAALEKLKAKDDERTKEAAQSEKFQRLEEIRDGEFRQLEAGHGRGARHETTHYLNMRTRFFHMELVEQWDSDVKDADNSRDAAYWLDLLVEQHRLFIEGAKKAMEMVAAMTQETI